MGSQFGYPEDYKPKSVAEQIKILRALFNIRGTADESVAARLLPAGAEGWFAIPRFEVVGASYNETVDKVLDLINDHRSLYDWCQGRLEGQYLRRHERTVKMLEALSEQQKGYDILVVACQFGLHHRGRSVRRAREVFKPNEFGLGAFEIGCMLLTHPERLQHEGDLRINCAGDEYAPGAAGDFSDAPYFSFFVDRIDFGTGGLDYTFLNYGSASGFLPTP